MSLFRARLKARDLVVRFALHRELPVRLAPVCEFIGFHIYEYPSGGIDGSMLSCLIGGQQRRFIMVAQNMPIQRQRFTVAHELGHHILHHDSIAFHTELANSDVLDSDALIEAEANAFASELLMPVQPIRDLAPKIRRVSKLAEIFNVSKEAIVWRLHALNFTEVLS